MLEVDDVAHRVTSAHPDGEPAPTERRRREPSMSTPPIMIAAPPNEHVGERVARRAGERERGACAPRTLITALSSHANRARSSRCWPGVRARWDRDPAREVALAVARQRADLRAVEEDAEGLSGLATRSAERHFVRPPRCSGRRRRAHRWAGTAPARRSPRPRRRAPLPVTGRAAAAAVLQSGGGCWVALRQVVGFGEVRARCRGRSCPIPRGSPSRSSRVRIWARRVGPGRG